MDNSINIWPDQQDSQEGIWSEEQTVLGTIVRTSRTRKTKQRRDYAEEKEWTYSSRLNRIRMTNKIMNIITV
jgi:hypothetical protein